MNRDKFVSGYLENLLNDGDVSKCFDDVKTEKEKELLKDHLKGSLEKSYDTYAKEYFDSKGIGSYLSTFLRWSGGVTDVAGTYMFWALGGAGFGLKGVGLAGKSLADLIDNYNYVKHAKTENLSDKAVDDAKIIGEGLVERVGAYLPLGVGELSDFMRGRSKFDEKVTSRAVEYAKNNFIDYINNLNREIEEKEPYIISLDKFKKPEYAGSESLAQAA